MAPPTITSWGGWGKDDQRGMLNLQTPASGMVITMPAIPITTPGISWAAGSGAMSP